MTLSLDYPQALGLFAGSAISWQRLEPLRIVCPGCETEPRSAKALAIEAAEQLKRKAEHLLMLAADYLDQAELSLIASAKTAKALNINVPLSLLERADRVME